MSGHCKLVLAATLFLVSCGGDDATSPGNGSLQITTVTIGSAPDPDGYLVQVGGVERPLDANGTVTQEVAPGVQSLLLTGLAPGCSVSGENPRSLTVAGGMPAGTTFLVSCPGSAVGQLAFTDDRDGNDEIYLVNADGAGLQRLTTNPAVDIQPTWSPDGSKLAFSSDRGGKSNIYVMNVDGSNVLNLSQGSGDDFLPAWSPDGSKIAFVRDLADPQTNWDIFVMDADGGNQTNLTNNADFAAAPAWSPDGTRIAFESDREAEVLFEIFVMNADGTGVVNVTNSTGDDEFPTWSPDGNRIAFMTDRQTNFEIFVADQSGTNPINLTNHPAADFRPEWSPEGDRIAFSSDRYGGKGDLLVMAPDGTGLIRLTEGGFVRDATWRP
jgi:TolB protein